jgi:hypothetical protein
MKILKNKVRIDRITSTATLLLVGWVLFEIFNFATTEFALKDIMGELSFLGMRWATLLALAFCVIDLAGIARMFTPEQGRDEPVEVWFLFGAWLLASALNATLTWWAMAVAINGHVAQGMDVVGQKTMLNVVPVVIAILVWLTRVMIIATFAFIGDKMWAGTPGSYYVKLHRPGNAPRLDAPSYRNLPKPYTDNYGGGKKQKPQNNAKPYYPERPQKKNPTLPPGALGDPDDEFDPSFEDEAAFG